VDPVTTSTRPEPVRAWHDVARSKDLDLLSGLLADDVVFRSPAVFSPQEGRAATTLYLTAAIAVLAPTLSYVDEWYAESSAVLEFEADLDGVVVHGVDMMRWNEAGKLVSFTVMVRPVKGLQQLMALMGAELARLTRQNGLAR
jgi:hypothetical protein